MFRQAEDELATNNIVILDASFSDKRFRNAIINKSERWNSKIFFIETKASDKSIKQRLLDREKNASISDARIDLLKSFKQKFESPGESLKDIYFKTNTSSNLDPDKNIKLLFREIIKRRSILSI